MKKKTSVSGLVRRAERNRPHRENGKELNLTGDNKVTARSTDDVRRRLGVEPQSELAHQVSRDNQDDPVSSQMLSTQVLFDNSLQAKSAPFHSHAVLPTFLDEPQLSESEEESSAKGSNNQARKEESSFKAPDPLQLRLATPPDSPRNNDNMDSCSTLAANDVRRRCIVINDDYSSGDSNSFVKSLPGVGSEKNQPKYTDSLSATQVVAECTEHEAEFGDEPGGFAFSARDGGGGDGSENATASHSASVFSDTEVLCVRTNSALTKAVPYVVNDTYQSEQPREPNTFKNEQPQESGTCQNEQPPEPNTPMDVIFPESQQQFGENEAMAQSQLYLRASEAATQVIFPQTQQPFGYNEAAVQSQPDNQQRLYISTAAAQSHALSDDEDNGLDAPGDDVPTNKRPSVPLTPYDDHGAVNHHGQSRRRDHEWSRSSATSTMHFTSSQEEEFLSIVNDLGGNYPLHNFSPPKLNKSEPERAVNIFSKVKILFTAIIRIISEGVALSDTQRLRQCLENLVLERGGRVLERDDLLSTAVLRHRMISAPGAKSGGTGSRRSSFGKKGHAGGAFKKPSRPSEEVPDCVLIAAGPARTMKYAYALAAKIPCVHYKWVLDSCSAGKMLPVKYYLLPRGYSLLERTFLLPATGDKPFEQKRALDFTKVEVLGDKDFKQSWKLVLQEAGAQVIDRLDRKNPRLDVVLCSGFPTDDELTKCIDFRIPLVSPEWVFQCLVHQKWLAYDAHEYFSYENYRPRLNRSDPFRFNDNPKRSASPLLGGKGRLAPVADIKDELGDSVSNAGDEGEAQRGEDVQLQREKQVDDDGAPSRLNEYSARTPEFTLTKEEQIKRKQKWRQKKRKR